MPVDLRGKSIGMDIAFVFKSFNIFFLISLYLFWCLWTNTEDNLRKTSLEWNEESLLSGKNMYNKELVMIWRIFCAIVPWQHQWNSFKGNNRWSRAFVCVASDSDSPKKLQWKILFYVGGISVRTQLYFYGWLGLPFTLIRHEIRAFWKRSLTKGIWKRRPSYRVRANGKISANGGFRNPYLLITMWSPWASFPHCQTQIQINQ